MTNTFIGTIQTDDEVILSKIKEYFNNKFHNWNHPDHKFTYTFGKYEGLMDAYCLSDKAIPVSIKLEMAEYIQNVNKNLLLRKK